MKKEDKKITAVTLPYQLLKKCWWAWVLKTSGCDSEASALNRL